MLIPDRTVPITTRTGVQPGQLDVVLQHMPRRPVIGRLHRVERKRLHRDRRVRRQRTTRRVQVRIRVRPRPRSTRARRATRGDQLAVVDDVPRRRRRARRDRVHQTRDRQRVPRRIDERRVDDVVLHVYACPTRSPQAGSPAQKYTPSTNRSRAAHPRQRPQQTSTQNRPSPTTGPAEATASRAKAASS